MSIVEFRKNWTDLHILWNYFIGLEGLDFDSLGWGKKAFIFFPSKRLLQIKITVMRFLRLILLNDYNLSCHLHILLCVLRTLLFTWHPIFLSSHVPLFIFSVRTWAPSQKTGLVGGVAQILIYQIPSPYPANVRLFVCTILNNIYIHSTHTYILPSPCHILILGFSRFSIAVNLSHVSMTHTHLLQHGLVGSETYLTARPFYEHPQSSLCIHLILR